MILILEQLTHGPDPPVSQVVNVIDHSLTIFQLNQVSHHLQNIPPAQDGLLILQELLDLSPDIIRDRPFFHGRHQAIG